MQNDMETMNEQVVKFFRWSDLFDHMVTRQLDHIRPNWKLTWNHDAQGLFPFWRAGIKIAAMLRIDENITLADWDLSENFTRTSGPGGQNVNKVATAVELRFEAARSPHLTPAVKTRLKQLTGRRWTSDGAIVIRAEETRSQVRNREIARARLAELIQKALIAPKRHCPTLASKRRRVEGKIRRGQVKTLRAKVTGEE